MTRTAPLWYGPHPPSRLRTRRELTRIHSPQRSRPPLASSSSGRAPRPPTSSTIAHNVPPARRSPIPHPLPSAVLTASSASTSLDHSSHAKRSRSGSEDREARKRQKVRFKFLPLEDERCELTFPFLAKVDDSHSAPKGRAPQPAADARSAPTPPQQQPALNSPLLPSPRPKHSSSSPLKPSFPAIGRPPAPSTSHAGPSTSHAGPSTSQPARPTSARPSSDDARSPPSKRSRPHPPSHGVALPAAPILPPPAPSLDDPRRVSAERRRRPSPRLRADDRLPPLPAGALPPPRPASSRRLGAGHRFVPPEQRTSLALGQGACELKCRPAPQPPPPPSRFLTYNTPVVQPSPLTPRRPPKLPAVKPALSLDLAAEERKADDFVASSADYWAEIMTPDSPTTQTASDDTYVDDESNERRYKPHAHPAAWGTTSFDPDLTNRHFRDWEFPSFALRPLDGERDRVVPYAHRSEEMRAADAADAAAGKSTGKGKAPAHPPGWVDTSLFGNVSEMGLFARLRRIEDIDVPTDDEEDAAEARRPKVGFRAMAFPIAKTTRARLKAERAEEEARREEEKVNKEKEEKRRWQVVEAFGFEAEAGPSGSGKASKSSR
ncbi:hypothetical protein JCM10207_007692 [Rhodosporidiobolus poonsookiae]